MVYVEHVAHGIVVAAACGVDKTCRVVGFGPFHNFLCLELSPTLVEGSPCNDAGIRLQGVDNLFPFVAEVVLRLGAVLYLGSVVEVVHLPLGPRVAARHILPYQYAKTVAPCVPTGRLRLHVLAYHVEAKTLCQLDVVAQGFVVGSGVQSVGPIALVKRTHLEDVAVVELYAHNAVGVASCRNLAHSGIALHFVHLLTVLEQTYISRIQVRIVRTP